MFSNLNNYNKTNFNNKNNNGNKHNNINLNKFNKRILKLSIKFFNLLIQILHLLIHFNQFNKVQHFH